ncbi:unnamed protein product [Ixodes pacificus]
MVNTAYNGGFIKCSDLVSSVETGVVCQFRNRQCRWNYRSSVVTVAKFRSILVGTHKGRNRLILCKRSVCGNSFCTGSTLQGVILGHRRQRWNCSKHWRHLVSLGSNWSCSEFCDSRRGVVTGESWWSRNCSRRWNQ